MRNFCVLLLLWFLTVTGSMCAFELGQAHFCVVHGTQACRTQTARISNKLCFYRIFYSFVVLCEYKLPVVYLCIGIAGLRIVIALESGDAVGVLAMLVVVPQLLKVSRLGT